jgi:hypothetical protein
MPAGARLDARSYGNPGTLSLEEAAVGVRGAPAPAARWRIGGAGAAFVASFLRRR